MVVKNGILRRLLQFFLYIFVIIYICTVILPIIVWIIKGNYAFSDAIEFPNKLIKEN